MLEDRSWQRDLPVKASELMKYMEKFSRALDRAIHRSSKSVLSSLFDIPITAMDPLAATMTQVRRAFEEQGIAPTEENLMAFVRTLRELEEPPSSLWPLLEAPLDTKAIQTWRMITDGRTRSAISYDALLTERLLLEERVDQELRSGMDVAVSESAQVELDRSRLDPLETPISERLGISESPIDRSAHPDLEFPTRAQQMLLQRADEIERGQLLNLMRALEETQNIEHLTDTEFFDLLDDFSKRLLGRSLTDREMRRIHE